MIQNIVALTPTFEDVFSRIVRVSQGEPISKLSERTCWNQVGLYLRDNPGFRGEVLLYGMDEWNYVHHAVLVDHLGKVAKDSYQGGKMIDGGKRYLRKDGQEYILLKRFKWP